MAARKIALILVVIIICIACTSSETASTGGTLLLEYEDINDATLTIYYMSPFTHISPAFITVDHLFYLAGRECDGDVLVQKLVIESAELKKNTDSINRLNNIKLIPLEYDHNEHIRICYVFESEEKGVLLEVFMWGGRDDIAEEDINWDENGKVINRGYFHSFKAVGGHENEKSNYLHLRNRDCDSNLFCVAVRNGYQLRFCHRSRANI